MKLFGSKNRNTKKKTPTGRQEPSAPYQDKEIRFESYEDTEPASGTFNEYGESEEEVNAAIRAYRGKKRKRVIAVFSVLAVLAIGLCTAYAIFVRAPEQVANGLNTHSVSATQPPEETEPAETAAPTETVTEAPAETDWEITENGRKTYCHTFVLMATDAASGNTDTMMVGMLDLKEATLDLISIPRDTLVNVSWDEKKANTLWNYSNEDFETYREYIADLIGYEVDNYVLIDLEAFEALIDAIGGVWFDVPREMHYEDPTQDLYIHINAGYQLLDGETALKMVRWRRNNQYNEDGYVMGDADRLAFQQEFLKEVANQVLSMGNLLNLPAIYQVFEDYVETSLSMGNIAWYAQQCLQLSSENIRFHTMPGNASAMIKNSADESRSVVSIYVDEWLEMLNTYLNPYTQEITEANVDILTFEGVDPYHSMAQYYSTSGVFADSSLITWNQYNSGY